jgi:hypothetical protein
LIKIIFYFAYLSVVGQWVTIIALTITIRATKLKNIDNAVNHGSIVLYFVAKIIKSYEPTTMTRNFL